MSSNIKTIEQLEYKNVYVVTLTSTNDFKTDNKHRTDIISFFQNYEDIDVGSFNKLRLECKQPTSVLNISNKRMLNIDYVKLKFTDKFSISDIKCQLDISIQEWHKNENIYTQIKEFYIDK